MSGLLRSARKMSARTCLRVSIDIQVAFGSTLGMTNVALGSVTSAVHNTLGWTDSGKLQSKLWRAHRACTRWSSPLPQMSPCEQNAATPAESLVLNDASDLRALKALNRTIIGFRNEFRAMGRASGIRISIAGMPAPKALKKSFPWYVRARYVLGDPVRADPNTRSKKPGYDVVAMYEDDHAIQAEHLFHVLTRSNRRWVRPDLAESLDRTIGQALGPRLSPSFVPGLLQYEDSSVSFASMYSKQNATFAGLNASQLQNDQERLFRHPNVHSPNLRLVNGCP